MSAFFFQYSVNERMTCTAHCPQFIIIELWHVLQAIWEILNDMRLPYKPARSEYCSASFLYRLS